MNAAGARAAAVVATAALVSLAGGGCASARASYQTRLWDYLGDPLQEREVRARQLADILAEGPAPPGVRVALAHHWLRMGLAHADAVALLHDEGEQFVVARAFLTRYRALMAVEEPLPAWSERAAPPLEHTLLVLPPSDDTASPRAVRALLSAVERPFVEAGLWVVPVEVSGELLAVVGGELAGLARAERPLDAATAARIGETFATDLALTVEVRRWDAVWASVLEQLAFDIRFALRDPSGAEAAVFEARGLYRRPEPAIDFGDDDGIDYFWPSSNLGPIFEDELQVMRHVLPRVVDELLTALARRV